MLGVVVGMRGTGRGHFLSSVVRVRLIGEIWSVGRLLFVHPGPPILIPPALTLAGWSASPAPPEFLPPLVFLLPQMCSPP